MINLDWNARSALGDEEILFHRKNRAGPPRVTIGIPTYLRGETIRRALSAVARQTYREFVLIISDNAGRNEETIEAVRQVAEDLPEVYLVGRPTNMGVMKNLNQLLSLAETDYFMWLADDDEITENYLEELVELLDKNSRFVAAQGRWKRMIDPETGSFERQLISGQENRVVRIFQYVAFVSDDTLYYGLHRTEFLRRCTFSGYVWPNAQILTNFCYVFLFDLIWRGPIGFSPNVAWIGHNYTDKQYQRAHAYTISDRLRTLVRRMNVYWMYCAKVAARNPLMLAVTIPAAVIGFVTDVFSASFRIGGRLLGRLAGR